MALLALIIVVRLSFLYGDYQTFIAKPFYYTDVEVLQQYQKSKKGKTYTILRVYSQDLDIHFFTRTHREENLLDKAVRLKLFPNQRVTFSEYLRTSFISSEINAIRSKAKTFKSKLLKKIEHQHSDSMISSFYQGIFLATPLPKNLREQISTLGISHLIALSGFHLAILSGVLFFLLRPLYRIFQQRYFPYRFDLIDIGFVVLLILGWYVWFVEAPDSLLRSYMMMLLGWSLLVMGMELLSFAFLVTVLMLLLALFPKMLLSLAFWFSILGVFYIFLLLQRFKGLNKSLMTLMISFGIFILMLPLVHMVFPVTSSLQLYSPLLSLAFSLFYPLSIALHILGIGGIFDSLLLGLFTLASDSIDIKLPVVYGIGYLLLSIGAIYSKWIFHLLLLVAIGFMGWMFIGFMI